RATCSMSPTCSAPRSTRRPGRPRSRARCCICCRARTPRRNPRRRACTHESRRRRRGPKAVVRKDREVTTATSSSGDQQDPRRSDDQKHGKEEQCHEQAEPIKFRLLEVAAADEDDVLAATLGRNDREVTAGKQQGKRHQRRGHAPPDADVKKNAEQSQ